ncbi:MAG: T9SS type A sorting domain-containing protein [Bacteroidetes bacterium]|nr:T9SS type A sorting domain-containing protein [Bacteroidota bacterium]
MSTTKLLIAVLFLCTLHNANAQWYGTPPSNFTWYYSDQGTIAPSGCSQSSPVLQYNISPNSYFIAYNFSGVAGTTYTFTLNPTINVCATGTCEIQLFDYAYNQSPGSVIFDQFGPIPQTKVWTCPVSKTYYLSLSDCSNGELFGALGVENVTFTYSSDGATTAPASCAVNVSPSNNATCMSTAQTLNWAAVGCATGYYLYLGTDAAATNIQNGLNVGNVLTYNPGALTNCTKYYWKVVPYNGVGTGTCSAAIWNFTVGTSPTAATSITASPNPVCLGSSCTLTRNAGNAQCGTWQWYSGGCGSGSSIGTGNSIVVTPTVSTTYYVRAEACANSICRSVTVNVNTIPTAASVSGAGTFCGSTTITATGGTGGTMYWQNTTSGGTSTTTPSTSQVVTASGTYYFRPYNSCGWGTEGSVSVTINPYPIVNAIGGGAASVMVGSQTPAFTNSTPGGTWSITNGSGTATINGSGVATGISTGTVTVNYSVTVNGCTTIVTAPLTIIAFMPVELLNFSATCVDATVTINWTTASEKDNDYFTIARSADAQTWNEIGIVNGAGNSSTIHDYEFIDAEVSSQYSMLNTQYYYRLKQTDFDGKHEYFSPVSESCSTGEWQLVFEIFSDDVLHGKLFLPEDADVTLNIIDLQGRIISREKVSALKGFNLLQMNIGSLENGLYFIKVYNEKKNILRKFVR